MGFLPVIIAVGGFFSLWTGLMLSTFKRYLGEVQKADEERRRLFAAAGTDPEAIVAVPDADLVKAFGQLSLGPDLLRAEAAYRKARRTYNKLIEGQPYRQIASITGYKPA